MTNNYTVRLARHVTDLAAAFNVQLMIVPGMDPAHARAGWLREDLQRPKHLRRFGLTCAPVTCEATYAVAMHELGHCLSPFGYLTPVHATESMAKRQAPQTLRDVQLQLEEEHAAWSWARYYALAPEGWTPTMMQVESLALETYHKNARQYGVKAVR